MTLADFNGKKPPYRVPSMDEIRALPRNGFKAVSTFSGCGGSSLGYKMAGFDVLWASEFIPAAQETYRANHAGTILDTRDIREVKPEDILTAIGMKEGELDLFDGSPPCASFSMAGKREKLWGQVKKYSDTEQRVDDLFFEFARLVKGVQPKVFVAENVKGLTVGKATEKLGDFQGDMFKTEEEQDGTIIRTLAKCGYRVGYRVLDAADLGVPQTRNRVIFIGIRKDLAERFNLQPCWPSPLGYRYTVRDALPWINGVRHCSHGKEKWLGPDTPSPTVLATDAETSETAKLSAGGWVMGNRPHGFSSGDELSPDKPAPTVPSNPSKGSYDGHFIIDNHPPSRVIHDTSGKFSQGDVTDKPCPAITVGVDGLNSYHFKVVPEEQAAADMSRFATGREWDKTPVGGQSDKFFQLVKPDPDAPCPTVTAAGGNAGLASVCHPFQKRKFYIAELKRLCGFPDDFILTGSYVQQWERLGRAVPPVMMSHVAKTVAEEILCKTRG